MALLRAVALAAALSTDSTAAAAAAAAASDVAVPSMAPAPAPPAQPRCAQPWCPHDFNNSGITGRFPSGAKPCHAATTCVSDVLPGCSDYSGDSDAPWGEWCVDTIENFDTNRTMPQNIGDENHPIYYFKPAVISKKYVLYIPPSGPLPLNKDAGRYEYFLFQWFAAQNIAVFIVRVPLPGWDGWDHVPAHTRGSPYTYNCSKILAAYYGMCVPSCDMCEKKRSTAIVEAAIDKATSLGYAEQVLMGWSSGGAMASAFLDHAHRTDFVTAAKTQYNVTGVALLSSGGQFCYAYDTVADLAGSSLWGACTAAKTYGCCPANLTEDYYWRNPHEYPRHPPTLLVQAVDDSDADWDAARFYHDAMSEHGATSTANCNINAKFSQDFLLKMQR